jgi:hypothetical protein
MTDACVMALTRTCALQCFRARARARVAARTHAT